MIRNHHALVFSFGWRQWAGLEPWLNIRTTQGNKQKTEQNSHKQCLGPFPTSSISLWGRGPGSHAFRALQMILIGLRVTGPWVFMHHKDSTVRHESCVCLWNSFNKYSAVSSPQLFEMQIFKEMSIFSFFYFFQGSNRLYCYWGGPIKQGLINQYVVPGCD